MKNLVRKRKTKGKRVSEQEEGDVERLSFHSDKSRTEVSTPSKEACFQMFNEGKVPQDVIQIGVPRSTAYSWYQDWNDSKEVLEEMDEGEKAALLFSLFKRGKSLVDVVIQTKLPYNEVADTLEKYEEASETLVLRADDAELYVNRFEELAGKIPELEQQVDECKKGLSRLDSRSTKVDKALEAQEELIRKRHPVLILKDFLGAMKCACGSTGVKFLLVCPSCRRNFSWG